MFAGVFYDPDRLQFDFTLPAAEHACRHAWSVRSAALHEFCAGLNDVAPTKRVMNITYVSVLTLNCKNNSVCCNARLLNCYHCYNNYLFVCLF